MKSRLVLPPPGVFQHADVYCRKRWRITQHLANCFWSRWRKEYLQLLQPRQRWTEERRNLQVNDVVLLKEEGVVRGHWPMGRVTEVHPSKDGLVRSISIQANGTIAKQPITKVVLLVASDNSKWFHADLLYCTGELYFIFLFCLLLKDIHVYGWRHQRDAFITHTPSLLQLCW